MRDLQKTSFTLFYPKQENRNYYTTRPLCPKTINHFYNNYYLQLTYQQAKTRYWVICFWSKLQMNLRFIIFLGLQMVFHIYSILILHTTLFLRTTMYKDINCLYKLTVKRNKQDNYDNVEIIQGEGDRKTHTIKSLKKCMENTKHWKPQIRICDNKITKNTHEIKAIICYNRVIVASRDKIIFFSFLLNETNNLKDLLVGTGSSSCCILLLILRKKVEMWPDWEM